MVTACVEAVDDRDVCKGVWPVCEDKVNLVLLCDHWVGSMSNACWDSLLEHCVHDLQPVPYDEVDQGITSGVACAQSLGTSAEF